MTQTEPREPVGAGAGGSSLSRAQGRLRPSPANPSRPVPEMHTAHPHGRNQGAWGRLADTGLGPGGTRSEFGLHTHAANTWTRARDSPQNQLHAHRQGLHAAPRLLRKGPDQGITSSQTRDLRLRRAALTGRAPAPISPHFTDKSVSSLPPPAANVGSRFEPRSTHRGSSCSQVSSRTRGNTGLSGGA